MQIVEPAHDLSVADAALAFVSFVEDGGAMTIAAHTWLTPAEAEYAGRLATVRRRAAWLAGRLAAKTAIARLAGAVGPPRDIEVLPASNGAPVVRGVQPGTSAIAVSISHTRGLAVAIAFDRRVAAMGIDLEVADQAIDPALLAFAFSEEERAAIATGEGDAAAHRRTLTFWTAKEAALKAARRGLLVPLEAVRLSWNDRRVPVGATVQCAPTMCVRFALQVADMDGYVLSIAREAGR